MPPFQPGLFGPVTHKLRWWLQKRWCDTQGVQDLQLMEFWIWLCLCCVDHSILRVIYISIQSHNMFCVYIYIYIYIYGVPHTHTYIHTYIYIYTYIHNHTHTHILHFPADHRGFIRNPWDPRTTHRYAWLRIAPPPRHSLCAMLWPRRVTWETSQRRFWGSVFRGAPLLGWWLLAQTCWGWGRLRW